MCDIHVTGPPVATYGWVKAQRRFAAESPVATFGVLYDKLPIVIVHKIEFAHRPECQKDENGQDEILPFFAVFVLICGTTESNFIPKSASQKAVRAPPPKRDSAKVGLAEAPRRGGGSLTTVPLRSDSLFA